MDFSLSRASVPVFEVLQEAGSTNDELVRRAAGERAEAWPDLSVVVTTAQTAGRGRLGRTWAAPAGKSLAVSLLLRPARGDGGVLAPGGFGWFPLLAGLAMTRAVDTVITNGVALKWPNDVLIGGKKVCGILSELLPNAAGVVVGAGLNLLLEETDLPTDTSTSLLLSGAVDLDPDAVLAAYLGEIGRLYRGYLDAGADPVASGLLDAVTERCETIGRAVRVELPSGEHLIGTATALDPDGRIVVESNTGVTAVAAGDVTHLRY